MTDWPTKLRAIKGSWKFKYPCKNISWNRTLGSGSLSLFSRVSFSVVRKIVAPKGPQLMFFLLLCVLKAANWLCISIVEGDAKKMSKTKTFVCFRFTSQLTTENPPFLGGNVMKIGWIYNSYRYKRRRGSQRKLRPISFHDTHQEKKS